MEKDKINEKIQLLEGELKEIKNEISPNEKNRWHSAIENLNKNLVKYQFLITLTIGILTVIYVQLTFNISPFESYNNTANSKKLADIFTSMGDKLMYKGKWKEAEKEYKSAIELQTNNANARLGLTKVQIFTPLEGKKFTDSEAVDYKLRHLREQFPLDGDIPHLQAINADGRLEFEDQRRLFNVSLELNHNYPDKRFLTLLELGIACQRNRDFICSRESFQKAHDLDPDSANANDDLGYINLLRFNFEEAETLLKKSVQTQYGPEPINNLAEVYKFSGDKTSKAIDFRKDALRLLDDGEDDGDWVYNFMPRSIDDSDWESNYVVVSTIDEKKAFLHFLLSIDVPTNFKWKFY